ncbi:YncE family protein [Streptosporangium sp. 'caverna']|uniref:YncE family protein n=1 Tax=Streptosporangium sp. 'caverna' TaxID=2202249 RepID=UPI001EF877D2|nr:YncE family protein [Streptosporangium sp. 'caverna']
MRRLRSERRRRGVIVPLIGLMACVLSACEGGKPVSAPSPSPPIGIAATTPAPRGGSSTPTGSAAPVDVYAHDRPGMLSPVVAGFPERVYVPNSESNTVSVIDPHTYQVVRTFPVGRRPQHVVPSWDLKTLWVNNNDGNSLTPIDPMTGKEGKPVSVDDPYNLYFSPDGRSALVMAERENRLDFLNPRTMQRRYSLPMPCRGINHADFTADETLMLASCEFSGQLVVIDIADRKVRAVIDLADGVTRRKGLRRAMPKDRSMPSGMGHDSMEHDLMRHGRLEHDSMGHDSMDHDSMHGRMPYPNMPQDVKLSPDGTTFYVADMAKNGVWVVDAGKFRVTGFIPTGAGAHGLYVSRDSKVLYVSNRGAGSVSVISFALGRPIATWPIPGGGSPDMGGVSADGRSLWLSGRYNGVVYVFDTGTGRLIRTINVGAGPHGLAIYPQPGRYSLGHTGVFR